MTNEFSKPATFSKKENDKLKCTCCAHYCVIAEGKTGICGVRQNEKSVLQVPYNYVSSMAVDPIEKKPLYHFYPGQPILSFGMFGCNLKCFFCQNYQISQPSPPHPLSHTLGEGNGVRANKVTVAEIVRFLKDGNIKLIAATYNEPLITSSWVFDVFRAAKKIGCKTVLVTNGFASKETLEVIVKQKLVDAMNIDVKCFSEAQYTQLGGKLRPVLDTVEYLKKNNIWIETTTLIIPGWNDDENELRALTQWHAKIDREMPWHVSAYYQTYKSTYASAMPEDIERAIDIGEETGIKHIYAGNLRGQMKEYEHTYCTQCDELLIERSGFSIISNKLKEKKCPKCGSNIKGCFN